MTDVGRVVGYKSGITNSGEWFKSRIVGLVHDGKLVLRDTIKLTNNHYLFYATKEEIDKFCSGELP